MRTSLLPALFLSASLLAAQEGPPGLKLVKGGRTSIGASEKRIEELLNGNREAWGKRGNYVGETPKHSVEVQDFYLGVTEVTVEQYATFLRATGHRPPIDFAKDAVNAAIATFNQEQGRLAQEAKLAGEAFERQKFDADAWWEDNWREAEWAVPEGLAARPVANVGYDDVRAYCAWAGVRPMTEFEFQRAARGNSDVPYPWGEEWDPKKAANIKSGRSEPLDVGSFPDGAVDGIHDLIGNVWEWTSSPYVAYPGFKKLSLKYGKGKNAEEEDVVASFDASMRVLVGGSIGMPEENLRVTMRQRASHSQTATQIGFRVAASRDAGLDLATAAWDREVKQSVLGETELLFSQTECLEHWTSEPGTVKVDGYAVITGHDSLVFVPVEELHKLVKPGELTKWTAENGPAFLGMFQTTVALTSPELGPGNYFLAWRGAGELELPDPPKAGEEEEEGEKETSVQDDVAAELPPWAAVPGFDAKQDQLIVFAGDGTPLVAIACAEPQKESIKSGVKSTMHYVAWQPPKKVDKDAPPPVPMDEVTLKVVVPSGRGNNGFSFRVPLKVEPGVVDASWN